MNRKINLKIVLGLCMVLSIISCENDDLKEENYLSSRPGKLFIEGYAKNDTIQVTVDDVLITDINGDKINTEFTKKVSIETSFIYQNTSKTVKFFSYFGKKRTELKSFRLNPPEDQPQFGDNIENENIMTFFAAPGIFIDNVYQYNPGVFSDASIDQVGFKFIFPAMNYISKSDYKGKLDAIITSFRGTELGVVENIGADSFSDFIEFPFTAPPFVFIELVKHGTKESYIPGETVKIRKAIKKNTSGLIVLNEEGNEDGSFKEVKATIDLTEYFDY